MLSSLLTLLKEMVHYTSRNSKEPEDVWPRNSLSIEYVMMPSLLFLQRCATFFSFIFRIPQ